MKYGSPERPIEIGVNLVEGGAEISVCNSGPSIPEIELKHLFQRSESGLHGTQQGWGIGLSVVRSLVEDLGGVVKVESTQALGTKFSVILTLLKSFSLKHPS